MTTEIHQPEAASLPAGRYEFKDAGIYIGEWLNEKAVGLGLITKDKCQGEYTGLWDAGMEKSGVFLWPNAPGAMYEGEWAHNRRNGHGVFTREDWVIKGKFVEDFIALGIKCKENSIGRFEGEFENGFPSFGVETYADGGSYAGEYKNGIREGLGVRTSIPYGEVINFFPEEAALAAEMALKAKRRIGNGGQPGNCADSVNGTNKPGGRRGSLLSQISGDLAEPGNGYNIEEEEPYSGRHASSFGGGANACIRDLRMSTKFRCGFVLSSQRSELVQRRQNKLTGAQQPRRSRETGNRSRQTRARSLTNLFNRSASRESIARVKRQTSANERSVYNTFDQEAPESIFTLDQEAIDPETVETFAGQWESDARHGYGVCERSDGVMYEGQWYKNKRHGYGQTKFRDGTCEQGRYHYGKLVFLSWSKGTKPHMLLYNYHIKMEVISSVKRARILAEQARMRANEATENLDNVFTVVERAQRAAESAREYSLETRELVKEMYPDFEQPGIKYLDDMVRLMRVTKHGNQAFESALNAAQEVLAGVQTTGVPNDQNGINTNDSRRTSQNLEVKQSQGSPVSRAGSYRLARRSRRRERSRQQGELEQSFSPSQNRRQLIREQQQQQQRQQQYPTVAPNQPLTLLVPQITNYDASSPSDVFDPLDEAQINQHQPSRPRVTRSRAPANQMYLNVPDSHGGWNNADAGSNDSDPDESDHSRVSRSPSVTTTYVVIPRVTDLHPESEVPNVPLAKLISNVNLMSDHFSQYTTPIHSEVEKTTGAKESSETQASLYPSMSPTTANSQSFGSQTMIGNSMNEATTFERSQQPGLVRRRTMPVFLTQRPVTPEKLMKRHLLTVPEPATISHDVISQASENQTLQRPHLTNHTVKARNNELISRDKLIYGQASVELIREESEEFSVYLVDDGIRKRVYSVENYLTDQQPGCTHTDNIIAHEPIRPDNENQYDEINHKLLALTDVKHEPLSLVSSNSIPVGQSISKTTKETSAVLPTEQARRKLTNLPVVSNVLLEDFQDQLPPLPTSFKESCLDLRPTGARYSVPNVGKHLAHTIPSGLSPDELAELSRETQEKQAVELARRQQGEIVIHFTDLFDWCNRNLILITVLLLNGTLAYIFARLAHDAESHGED